jgi:hypothetical protein
MTALRTVVAIALAGPAMVGSIEQMFTSIGPLLIGDTAPSAECGVQSPRFEAVGTASCRSCGLEPDALQSGAQNRQPGTQDQVLADVGRSDHMVTFGAA